MAARKFDRFMVAVEIASNAKIGRFSDREFRCLVQGVWPLAAKARPRGFLAVAGHPATPDDVAKQARCSRALATKTLQKMRGLQMLEREKTSELEHVHDWDEINPEPRGDRTNAVRQARSRSRRSGQSNGVSNGEVTPGEVKKVEGVTTNAVTQQELSSESSVESARLDPSKDRLEQRHIRELFAYWQLTCRHPHSKLTEERRKKVRARLREGYSVEQIRQGIDGAAKNPPADKDSGVIYDDLVSVCRNGAQLERYIDRAKPGRGGRQQSVETIDSYLARRGAE
jgi:hypothetical protein